MGMGWHPIVWHVYGDQRTTFRVNSLVPCISWELNSYFQVLIVIKLALMFSFEQSNSMYLFNLM